MKLSLLSDNTRRNHQSTFSLRSSTPTALASASVSCAMYRLLTGLVAHLTRKEEVRPFETRRRSRPPSSRPSAVLRAHNGARQRWKDYVLGEGTNALWVEGSTRELIERGAGQEHLQRHSGRGSSVYCAYDWAEQCVRVVCRPRSTTDVASQSAGSAFLARCSSFGISEVGPSSRDLVLVR